MLGDSITAQHLHTEYFEAYIRTRYPSSSFTFYNAGLSGDTAAGALTRLDEQVLSFHPQVVTIELGVNDADGGLPAVRPYLQQMAQLAARVEAAGATPVLLTADPDYDGSVTGRLSEINSILDLMATGVVRMAVRRQEPYADQFHLLLDFWGRNYSNPQGVELHGDPWHPGAAGHLTKAWACLRGLGAPALVSSAAVDYSTALVSATEQCQVTGVACAGGRVSFTRLDACLPMPVPDDGRDGLRLVPLAADLSHYGLTITNLPPGSYFVRIDGIRVACATAAQLAAGVELGAAGAGPVHDQCQQVLALVQQEHAALAGTSRELRAALDAAVQPLPHTFSVVPAPAPPTVVRWSPRGSGVSPTAPVSVLFSEPMQRAATQEAFVLTPPCPGVFTWSGPRLTFTPAVPWPTDRRTRVTLRLGACSLSGVNLAQDFTWCFQP